MPVEIISQSAGEPRRYQLSPEPSEEWWRAFDRAARQSTVVGWTLPGVEVQRISGSDVEATGVTVENSLEVDTAVRSLVKQANHRVLLNHINRPYVVAR